MKKIIFSLLALCCMMMVQAQTLSGKRISRDIPVTAFSELKASGVIELTLVQGSKESVTVEADEALQAFVTVASNGNTLEIDTKKLNNKNIKGAWKLNITVHFRNLNQLSVATVGHIKNEGTLKFDDLQIDIASVGNTELKLDADKLHLKSSTVGNVELDGSAKTAIIQNSSVGNLQAEGLKVGTLEISNTGIGNAEVNAENIAHYENSMLGKVRNRGQKLKWN